MNMSLVRHSMERLVSGINNLFDGKRYSTNDTKRTNGYATLLSVLIVGTVGSTIALVLLVLGIKAGKSSSALEGGMMAHTVSEACVEAALKQIVSATSYTGTATINLGPGVCTYTVTQPTSPTRLITTSSTVGVAVRKMTVNVTINSTSGQEIAKITSWQESQ